jgi:two-component system, cell cycle response regulator CpdR
VALLLSILVVEDDTAVRDLVLRMLSEKGFGVLTANTAYDALHILKQKSVDLLFTDIIMPGMDGVELAQEARRLRPGLKVLFATGYAQVATKRSAFHFGRVLYKPLREPELVQAVEQLLAAGAAKNDPRFEGLCTP